MKLTGAVLCVFSFLFLATSYLKEEKRRTRTLSGLSYALMLMKTELCAKSFPMHTLTGRAAETSEGVVKQFFCCVLEGFEKIGEKEFSEVWVEAARGSFSFFNPEQLRMICFPGEILGKTAIETQAETLENSALYFRTEAEMKKEKIACKKKLVLGMSACAGLLTVIVLC